MHPSGLLGTQRDKADRHENHLSALILSAVLCAWGLPSVPVQAEQQQAKQGSSYQHGNTEARDARTTKTPLPRINKLNRHGRGLA